tara:strand:- start:27 stop:482 length:456 start_codon:yes stop_codon:yes gene_type:complete
MQPIYQNALPLLGYASPVQQPAEEEMPLGLLALIAKQQEDAQGGQQQVVQGPMLNAQRGIGGMTSDNLFNVSANDLGKGVRGMFGGGKVGAMMNVLADEGQWSFTQPMNIDRDTPIPEYARPLLQRSDPDRLRRMDAYQAFDAANKEEAPI